MCKLARMTTGTARGMRSARKRYVAALGRFVVAAAVAACHGPSAATVGPAPSRAASDGVARVVPDVEARLEFRLADSVAFAGSESKPRLFEERRVFAATQPVVGTAEFRSVEASISETGMPVLNLELCPEAGVRLTRFTADHVGRQLMILAGNDVLSVAVITGAFGARVQVAGLGTVMKTMAFAQVMRTRLQQPACGR